MRSCRRYIDRMRYMVKLALLGTNTAAVAVDGFLYLRIPILCVIIFLAISFISSDPIRPLFRGAELTISYFGIHNTVLSMLVFVSSFSFPWHRSSLKRAQSTLLHVDT